VGAQIAFVEVSTTGSGAFVTVITGATEAAKAVGAGRVGIAVVGAKRTLIEIGATGSRAFVALITGWTSTTFTRTVGIMAVVASNGSRRLNKFQGKSHLIQTFGMLGASLHGPIVTGKVGIDCYW
jgi:hypothetical protein